MIGETTSTGSARLGAVSGLRGIAILGVIFYHLMAGRWSGDSLPLWLSPLLTNGWTGVNLFFILSGFVLFLPYADGTRAMATAADRVAFYYRRAWRLLPLFVVAAVVEWWLAPPRDLGELASVLSLTFVLDPRYFGPSFNPPLWSIGVEIAFSAIFPLLVVLARRHGMKCVVIAALAVALTARVLGILRFPALQGPTFNSDTIICRIDEFVLGMMIAGWWVSGRLPRRPGLVAAVGLALVGIAWIGFDQVLHGFAPPLGRAVFNDVLDAGLAAVVLGALVPATRLAATLSWGPLRAIGAMSYSLYIWHLPLLRWLMPDRRLPLDAGVMAAFLVLTFAVAALSYSTIEFPRRLRWRRPVRLHQVP